MNAKLTTNDVPFVQIDKREIQKKILKIAIPSASEQVLIMIVGVVSTVLVGRLSAEALSAVGLVNTLLNFILVLFSALSTGSTVLVARMVGEENPQGANLAAKQSLLIVVFSSLLITGVSYAFAEALLLLFFSSAESEVIDMALIYFRIALLSYPLLLINVIAGGILRGAGDAKTPMIVAYIVNILNVVLGYILIFGLDTPFFIVEAMGIRGAAIAVTFARAVGGILMLLSLIIPGRMIRISLKEKWTIDIPIIRRMMRVGLPATLEQVIVQGGILMLQVLITGMGTLAIAVYQIGMSVYSISFMPVWGFAIAATTLVGQSLGAKQLQMAEIYTRHILRIGMVMILALGGLIFIFAAPLISIYSTDPEVLQMGAQVIKIFSISIPFLCVTQIVASALRGAGDLLYTTLTSFVGIWVFRLLLSLFFDHALGLGIYGVWIAICFDFAIRSVMYYIRFQKGRWKTITI